MNQQQIRDELAWAAGLFDGEGCIRAYCYPNRKGGPSYCRFFANVSQDGENTSLLERFHRAVGGRGAILHKKSRRPHEYLWQATAFLEVSTVLWLLWPWLGEVKRADAMSALATMYEYRAAA
jgi:hypothetical protein